MPARMPDLMPALQLMLNQLESHRLEVQLVPLNPRLRNYNEGGCRRVVVNQPPKWYRDFCNRHPSSRGVRRGKFDTRIRRANVMRLLARLACGKPSVSKYREEMLAVAERLHESPPRPRSTFSRSLS